MNPFFSCHWFPVTGPSILSKVILFFSYVLLWINIGLFCYEAKKFICQKSLTKSIGSASSSIPIFRAASICCEFCSFVQVFFKFVILWYYSRVTLWREHTCTTFSSSPNLSNYYTNKNPHLFPWRVWTASLRKKMPVFGVILVRIFPAFSRIRTEYGEILRISPYALQMRENAGNMQTRITPNTDTFYAVLCSC